MYFIHVLSAVKFSLKATERCPILYAKEKDG
jgi:hypothetical protein